MGLIGSAGRLGADFFSNDGKGRAGRAIARRLPLPFLARYLHAGFGCLCFFLAGGFGAAGLTGFFGRGASLRKLISDPFGFHFVPFGAYREDITVSD